MDPKLAQRVTDADVMLALGTRLGEIATRQYSLLEPPRPRQTLIHVHADPDELGRVYEPELAIVSGLAAVRGGARGRSTAPAAPPGSSRRAPTTSPTSATSSCRASCELAEVMAYLRERLPEDAVITNGAGNYTVWAHRFYEFHRYGTQLAPCAGAMGYGVPAAHRREAPPAGAAGRLPLRRRRLPDERARARHRRAVRRRRSSCSSSTTACYGTIRMHQERQFRAATVATDLVNPDFVAYAGSFGAHATLVERNEEFAAAFEAALAAGRPALHRAPRRPGGDHAAGNAQPDQRGG